MNNNKVNKTWTLEHWEEMTKISKKSQQCKRRKIKKKVWEEIARDQPIETQTRFDDVS